MAEEQVARPSAHDPQPEITPAEFERFVLGLFEPLRSNHSLRNLRIQNHEVVEGLDGEFDFDATVRYEVAGMAFLVLVEAKLHKDPIKREMVQVLHQKLQSVGAQKAVLVSTAPFQSGALTFALKHGISLVTVTEGRFTFAVRGATPQSAPPTRDEAARLGAPTFVGHAYSSGDGPGAVRVTLMSPEDPNYLAEALLFRPAQTAG